jgi:hypothetical protein
LVKTHWAPASFEHFWAGNTTIADNIANGFNFSSLTPLHTKFKPNVINFLKSFSLSSAKHLPKQNRFSDFHAWGSLRNFGLRGQSSPHVEIFPTMGNVGPFPGGKSAAGA